LELAKDLVELAEDRRLDSLSFKNAKRVQSAFPSPAFKYK
jgi:hypothetical protein